MMLVTGGNMETFTRVHCYYSIIRMCKLVEEVVDNDTDYYEDYDGNDGELD
jgi:hypothetical protein